MTLRHKDSKTGTPRTRGRTWQRIRLSVLADEPLCRACQAEDRVTAAAEVDHIVPLHKGGTDARENLQGLCHECHTVKSLAEMGMERREEVGLDGWPVPAARGGRVRLEGSAGVNRLAPHADPNRHLPGVHHG